MKKLILIVLLFNCSTLFAQKFSIKSDNGNIFYLDQSHRIRIKVEGFDSSKIIATASLPGIMGGGEDKYTMNLDAGHLDQRRVGDSVRIDVFVMKEDGNYMIGGKTFFIARKNDFGMGLDKFRSGDKMTIADLISIKTMAIAFDDEWTKQNGNGYKVVSYSCILVPKSGEAEALYVQGAKMSNTIKEIAKRMGPDTKIIFDDIVLQNDKGDKKRGSRIFLTIKEERGTYLYPFAEKDAFTIDELLKVQTMSARVGTDSPHGGEVYQITHCELLLVLKLDQAAAYVLNNDQFSEGIKNNIKDKMKPGDRILIDNITYIRPDGTYGMCPPVRIFIR
mgnify:CR=1 FL=1